MKAAPLGAIEEGSGPLGRLMGFVQYLRGEGFRFGLGETQSVLEGLLPVLMEPQRMRWGLRCLVCGHVGDWRRFDALFDAYWHGPVPSGPGARGGGQGAWQRDGTRPGSGAAPAGDHAGASAECAVGTGAHGGASAGEFTTETDFGGLHDPAEVEEAGRLAAQLAKSLRPVLWRRFRAVRRGRYIHLRRTLRRNLAHGAVPIDRVFRRRRRRLPRLVLVLDVSRSMSLYSHVFLRFAGGILEVFRDAYAFVYHTHLESVTDAVREPHGERVAGRLQAQAAGWGGGTRIGACLGELLRQRPKNLLHRRTIVIIVSDGLDTGSPEDLAHALGRLRQRVRRVVWCNPLLGRDGYEPLARGMQAALPYTDLFAAAHNLRSLAALIPRLAALS